MNSQHYNYLDSDLTLDQVNSDYSLLLQIYPASFSYAIVYQNTLMAWAEDCELKVLDEPGEAHELLNYGYSNVVAGLQSTGFTLVPSELFNEDKLDSIARYLDVKTNEKVLFQKVDDDNYIVYKVDEKVAETAEIFGLDKAVFMNQGWINAISKSNPFDLNLYLNIDKKKVDIFYFVHHKIRYYNSFEFSNPDELAYYVAYVAKELSLEPHKINLVISGDFNRDDAYGTRLAEFFNGVDENDQKILSFPPEVFPHQLQALVALSLCVSSVAH